MAALDPRHAIVIADQIRKASGRGIRSVLVVHDVGFAGAVADRVVCLGRGGTVQAGPPSEVLKQDVLEELFGCRFGDSAAAHLARCTEGCFRITRSVLDSIAETGGTLIAAKGDRMGNNWINLLIILLAFGGPAASWIVQQLREKAEQKHASGNQRRAMRNCGPGVAGDEDLEGFSRRPKIARAVGASPNGVSSSSVS